MNNDCPCTRDCPRRAPGCGAKCKEYKDWKAVLAARKRQQRPPNTVGYWDRKAEQLVETINRRQGRKAHGGGHGEG